MSSPVLCQHVFSPGASRHVGMHTGQQGGLGAKQGWWTPPPLTSTGRERVAAVSAAPAQSAEVPAICQAQTQTQMPLK